MKKTRQILVYSFLALIMFFTISCDKELSSSSPPETPPNSKIFVNSLPQGFKIWLNGKNTGRVTPDTIPWLEPKEHEITLKKYRWLDNINNVGTIDGDVIDIDIDFLALPSSYGSISFRSEPTNAEIYLNDSLLQEKTPHEVSGLLPGVYKVDYDAPEHRRGTINVEVFSSNTTNNFFKLRDTTVWVDILSSNSNLPSNNLQIISVDSSNTLWIASSKSLIKLKDNVYEHFTLENSLLPSDIINFIEVDENNTKYIGTGAGLVIISDGVWTIINTDNSGLQSNMINDIEFTDDPNKYYLGTNHGVVKVENGIFTQLISTIYFPPPLTPIPLIVSTLITIDEDKLLIGTTAYGIFYYNPQTDLFIEHHEMGNFYFYASRMLHAPTNSCVDFQRDLDGTYWITYNQGYAKVYDDNSDFGAIVEVAKPGGIAWYKDDEWSGGDDFVQSPNRIERMHIDKRNIKWIATKNGLVRFDAANNKSFINKSNSLLSHNHVTDLTIDKNGIIWITTDGGGLNKFKGELEKLY
jgi:sugar lactone lactonase YvrE